MSKIFWKVIGIIALLFLLSIPLSAEIPRPDKWVKETLRIDGWSFFHYLQGNLYGRIRSSETMNGWVGLKPPPNHQIFIENLTLALAWELYEFADDGEWDWETYDDFYGGYALLNNSVDVGLSCLGCVIAMRYGKTFPIKYNKQTLSLTMYF